MPHQDEYAPIQCHLVDYALENSDQAKGPYPYEALSYVWGAPERPRLVYTEMGYLTVTENLHAALSRLRDWCFPRVVWADAICINQDDEEERSTQVELMAIIYAKAIRVVVWLEEHAAETYSSQRHITAHGDKALECIRDAAEGRATSPLENEMSREAILTLFQRSWFRRIWVLQEVSAARQILIMTRFADIDGHAFCLGLKTLNVVSKDPGMRSRIQSALYLIKGAIFRHRYDFRSGRVSLGICPLGQLIDMYQNREATDRLDKVYALLGMSSDNYRASGLSIDYKIPWKDLFHHVVESLVGPEATVGVWAEEEVAVIKTQCHIVGHILEVSSSDTWNDEQIITVFLSPHVERKQHTKIFWALQITAKLIQRNDIVCVLQGVSGPTIVSLYEDYCAIIAIKIAPKPIGSREDERYLHDLQQNFTSNLFLVWEWEKPLGGVENSRNYDSFIQNRTLKDADTKMEDPFDNAARLHIVGIILERLGQHEKAAATFRKAISIYDEKLSELKKFRCITAWGGENELYAERLRLMASILCIKFGSLSITEDGMIRIAQVFDPDLMELLLDRRGIEIQLRERVLMAAAENARWADTLIGLLLDRWGDQITITERLLKTVSEKGASSSVLRVLGELSGLSIDCYIKHERRMPRSYPPSHLWLS
ncbi:heterokaryon incompatibility protein-domain-containing protein [Xylaria curta]|nr:heterokaryon incompatibility protein-domain-containing protein [Xylaria curta]